jgi:hypothetical protein
VSLSGVIERCAQLGVPVDVAITHPMELRFASALPGGFLGKLHLCKLLSDDVDRQPIPCGTAPFEGDDPDAGPVTGERVAELLLTTERLCRFCVDKFDAFDMAAIVAIDEIAGRLADLAEMIESARDSVAGGDPVNVIAVGALATEREQLDKFVAKAEAAPKFDVVKDAVAAARERIETAFTDLVATIAARPDNTEAVQELLAAITADQAKQTPTAG